MPIIGGRGCRRRASSSRAARASEMRILDEWGNLIAPSVSFQRRTPSFALQTSSRSPSLGKRHNRGTPQNQESKAPVPLTDLLAVALLDWQSETAYAQPNDWVFASTTKNGKTPWSSSILTAAYLRPAAIAAGVKLEPGQRFGFRIADGSVDEGSAETDAGDVLQVRKSPSSI
jgi:hypothetical protein